MRYRNDKMDSETSVDVSKGVLVFQKAAAQSESLFCVGSVS